METPLFLIKLMRNFLNLFTNEKRKVEVIDNYERYDNLDSLWKDGQLFYKLRDEFYEFCKEKGIEALILPTYPVPAPLIGNSVITMSAFFYMMIINMLNLPSISIPCGLNLDVEYKTQFKDHLADVMKKDVNTSKGMPIGFQIAALPGNDEIALRVARDCSNVLDFKYNDITFNCEKNEEFKRLRKLNLK